MSPADSAARTATCGGDGSERIVAPAQQRLSAADASRAHVELRLELQA